MSTAGKMVAAGIALGVIGGVALYGYWTDFEYPLFRSLMTSNASSTHLQGKPRFHCDGRQRCEQMTSCEEAMFFLKNCTPNELDKDKDGIPCEVQWCQK